MRDTFVYFIRPVGMDGPIKIGMSEYPTQRVRTLMSWSPFELEIVAMVPGGRELERALQEHFAYCHLRGEWFDPSIELREAIAAVLSGTPIDQAVDLTKRGRIEKGRIKRVHPATRERMSVFQRINGRLRGWSRKTGKPLVMPDHIEEIIRAWQGDWQDQIGTGVRPTEEQFAEIEAFIEGLPDTAVLPRWMRSAA